MRRPFTLEISGREPLNLPTLKEAKRAFDSACSRKANRIRDIIVRKGSEVRLVSYANFHDLSAA